MRRRRQSGFNMENARAKSEEVKRLISLAKRSRNKRVTVKAGVNDAKSRRSPLHRSVFALTDRQAAQKYRENIIRRIASGAKRVHAYADTDKLKKDNKVFVHNRTLGPGYAIAADHLKVGFNKRITLREAAQDVSNLIWRFEKLEALSAVRTQLGKLYTNIRELEESGTAL